jgi:prepilin-type N-terminal cleavage/methylation domain-containing protein
MKHGFSLIELSIVLVILGLLTGGILAGKSLIRASELRSVSTEYSRYVTAAHAFRDKYFALPGDMINASAVWGALDGNDGTGSDCRGESSGLPTCNGNGDGQICPGAACSAATYEASLIWKHLANAGMIEGSYTGNAATNAGNTICISATSQFLGGCTVPASKLAGAMWTSYWLGSLTSASTYFDGQYGNAIFISGNGGVGAGGVSILKPEELWNIDTKLDDGLPGTGKLVGVRWNSCATGAANQADVANARYAVTSTSVLCLGIFRNVF